MLGDFLHQVMASQVARCYAVAFSGTTGIQ
jgi:hypothetical protein